MRTESQIRQQIASLRLQLRQLKAKRIGTVIRKGRGSRDRDEELKRARGYTDPGSYVRRDGSEVLKREDWLKRKAEIWERDEGKCQFVVERDGWTDIICGKEGHDPHHKVERRVRRDDRAANLRLLCRNHHDLVHGGRKPRFGEKA